MSALKPAACEAARFQEVENSESPQKEGVEQLSSRDVALQLVDTLRASDVTPEEDHGTLRRIDAVLVPVMFLSFALQYMDKACLTGAALFGILTDLRLFQM
jgi:hypothetical protein